MNADVGRKLSSDSNLNPEHSNPSAQNVDLEKHTSPINKAKDNGPPDGGFEAWMVILGAFCTVFASFGWINCIGVFQNYYETNSLKSYSSSTIAWIPSTESFMLFFWGPVAGKLTDDYGPRIPILLGLFLHVLGLMMTSISTQYYQIFLAQSVCSALGCCFLFYPTITVCSGWFLKHRALALGIAFSGSSIGGVVMPIMVQKLIDKAGFGWAMRGVAFMILFLLVIGNLTLKARLPPTHKPFRPKAFFTPFKEKPFLLLTIGSFFLYLGGFLPFNFLIVEAQANGMSTQLAGYLVPITNAASTFGRIVPAQLGDMYGVFNVMIVNTLLGAIFILAVWLPSASNAPLIVFAILYGFTSGCIFSIVPAMVAGLSDPAEIGTRNGALYCVSAVGALIGSPIAGAISNAQHGGFAGLIIFSAVCLLLGAGFAVLSRQAQVGLKLKVKV
ncbi:monocarboxylate permease-like protein [Tothia fuscella]|uniref:Monocarboxylate permease-like protein n=1 Tax=Tothia fuscella TaxID=1048955 RepID=A0A9P4NKB1_9PEZI|nr:monocarboxylate permease-like protein [Tothia fuscella]